MAFLTVLRIIHLLKGFCMFYCWFSNRDPSREHSCGDCHCFCSVITIGGYVVSFILPHDQEGIQTAFMLSWKVIVAVVHGCYVAENKLHTDEARYWHVLYIIMVGVSIFVVFLQYGLGVDLNAYL